MNGASTSLTNATAVDGSTAQALKPTLLATGIVVAIGLLLALGAGLRYYDKIESRRHDIALFKQSQQQIIGLTRDVENLVVALPTYQQLQNQGAIGRFAKTLEIDRFEETVTDHPSRVSSFSLGAFETLLAPVDLPLSRLSLGRHELTFDARPLHEIHLLDLLDDLKQVLGGLPLLKGCTISRTVVSTMSTEHQTDSTSALTTKPLRARCAIDWYLFDTELNFQDAAIDINAMTEPR